jgi:hypothetical protein
LGDLQRNECPEGGHDRRAANSSIDTRPVVPLPFDDEDDEMIQTEKNSADRVPLISFLNRFSGL